MLRPTEIVIPATRSAGLSSAAVNGSSRTHSTAPDSTPRPTAPHSTAAVEKPRKKPARARPVKTESKPGPGRDFIIAYRGEFVGHYRSSRRMTTKNAFARVAEQFHQELGGDFDIDALELFRPVALTTPTSAERQQYENGSFRWFHSTTDGKNPTDDPS